MDEKMLQQAVTRFQAGDEQGFNMLYSAYYNRVKSGLYYMLNDEHLAEDFTQDAFLKVYQYIDQLKEPGRFPYWVNRIAANCANDYLKKGMATEKTFTSLTPEGEEESAFPSDHYVRNPGDYQPEQAYSRQETQRLIREILDDLPDGQRISVTLYYYNQMKVKEIAEITGVKENAVKQSLYQARKKITAKVEELEKKGTKLYSLAPFSFFLWLFHAEAEASALVAVSAAGASAVAAAAAAAGVAGAGATGSAAVGSAGGLGAWLAGLPGLAKAGLGVLVMAAVIGGGIGIGSLAGKGDRTPSPETVTMITSEAATESSTAETSESSTEETTPAHVHNWVEVTETIHHDAEYEVIPHEAEISTETEVIHHDAVIRTIHHEAEYTEETTFVPNGETYNMYGCPACGATGFIYEGPGSDMTNLQKYGELQHNDGCTGSGALVPVTGYGGDYETIQVLLREAYDETVLEAEAWDETVTHTVVEKEAWDETVLVSDAWDETIVTGCICEECGETKPD